MTLQRAGNHAVGMALVAVLALLLLAVPADAVVTAFTYIAPGPNNGNQQLAANRRSIPTFQIQIDTSNDIAEPFGTGRFFDQNGTLRAAPTIPRNTPSPSGEIPVFEGRTQLLAFGESALTPFPPGFPGPTVVGNRSAFFDADTGPPDHPRLTGLVVTNGSVTGTGNARRVVYGAQNIQNGPLRLDIEGLVRNIPRPTFTVAEEVLATVNVAMTPVQFSSSIAPETSPRTTQTGPFLVPFSFPVTQPRTAPGSFGLSYNFTQVPDGVYELRFTARDVFNQASPTNPTSQTILIIDKDTRAPRSVWIKPPDRPAFVIDGPNPKPPFQGDKFTARGFASDERGLSTTIVIEVSNRSNDTTVYSTTVTSTATAGSQPFLADLDFSLGGPILSVVPPALPAPPAVSQELYRVTCRAVDQAGNRSAQFDSFYVIRDFAPTVTPAFQEPPPGFATGASSVRVSGNVTNIINLRNLEEHGIVDFEVTLSSAITPTIITTLIVPGIADTNTHASELDNGTTSTPPGTTYATFPIDICGRIPNSFSFFVFANIANFPDGRIFVVVRTVDQVGNISAGATGSFIKGPVGPKVTLDFSQSGPDDNYDPISGFPPNRFGANDNLFFISLKSPEIADNGTGVPTPVPAFTDPGTRDLLRVSGTATDINTPVARVEASGAGVPTISVSAFGPSTAVTYVFDPNNGSGIDVSKVEEGIPTLITLSGFNTSGQSGVTTSILVFRDVTPARRPLIDFPAEQPFFTGQNSMRLEGRAEPGSLVAILTPPSTGTFVLPIPTTQPNRIPRRDSQYNSIPANAQTTVAGPDGKWALLSVNISTVATGVTQPTTLFVQAIDTFDNTDPAESVEPFEIFKQDVPGDIVDVTLDPIPNGRNVSVYPVPPTSPVFVGLEVLTFRVTYNTLLTSAPSMTVKQFGAQARRAVLLSSAPSTAVPTQVLLYQYDVLTTVDQFDGRADLDFTSGLDVFGRVPNPTPVAQAFIVDSVAPQLAVTGVQAFLPHTGAQTQTVTTLAADLLDPVAGNGSGTASGVNRTLSRIRLFGPLERVPTVEISVVPVTPTAPYDVAAAPVTPLVTDGTYEVRIEAEDRVANGAVFTSNFILDRQAIATPLIRTNPADGSIVSTLPRFGNDSAVFSTIDNIRVSLPPPSLAGMPVSTVRFLDPNRAPIGATPVATGVRTLAVPVRPPLATDGSDDGVYFIETDAVDQAGNRSPTVTSAFTYDTVRPLVLDIYPTEFSAVRWPLREVRARVADGIPMVPNPYPLSPSGLDLDRAVIRLKLLRASYPNTTAANTFVSAQRRMRTEPGSRVGNLPIEAVSLDLLDSAGMTRSLTADGTEDGLYAIEVKVQDRAGNATRVTSTFIFDSQAPLVALNDFPENSFLADTSFTITGTAFDLGPGGFDRGAQAGTYVARSVRVRLEGSDAAGRPTTAAPFFDFRDAQSVVSTPSVRPTTPGTDAAIWSFSATIPTSAGPARLYVEAVDRAGNRTVITRNLIIRNSPLPAPLLESPRHGLVTRAQTMSFGWKSVRQARRYDWELRRVTPAVTAVLRSLSVDHPQVSLGPVDLVGLLAGAGATLETTRDNLFEWRMRSVDVTRVNTGPWSAPSRFTVDLVSPAVAAVRFNGRLASASTVLGAGTAEVTVEIADSGGVDLRNVPQVSYQLADRAIAPQSVRSLDYTTTTTGARWRGRFDLPPAGVALDPNGAAFVTVRGGQDLAGNPMATVTAPFQVNQGPAFDARVFPNPLEPSELIVVVRSYPSGRLATGAVMPVEASSTLQILSVLSSLGDGAAESLATTPSVRVSQQGTQKLTTVPVTVVLGTAVPNSAFAGSYKIEPGLLAVLDFRVTGTDLHGTTTTRSFSLNVAAILARTAVKFHAIKKDAVLEFAAGGVDRDRPIYWVDADNAPGAGAAAKAGLPGGLFLVRDLGAFLPEHAGLRKAAILRAGLGSTDESDPDSGSRAGRVGLYRKSSSRWVPVHATVEGGRLSAEVASLGHFALMEDRLAPAADLPRLEPRGLEGPSLRAKVSDGGSGLDEGGLAFELDGVSHRADYDEASGEARLVVPAQVEAGLHSARLVAKDRAGNAAAGPEARFALAGYQGLGEVLAVPNPARTSPATLRYRLLGSAESVTVKVYDAGGRQLERLEGPTAAGLQQVDWLLDGAANGVYFFKVEAQGGGRKDRRTGKLVVLR